MSEFDDWFRRQHGARNLTSASDDELRERIIAGQQAEAELRRRQSWDERRTSALYAWTARP